VREAEVVQELNCYHCGDPCQDEHIVFEEKDFCCHGCQTVFQILDENDLCDYYDLEQTPGYSQVKKAQGLFDYLSSQEVKQQLLDFASEDQERVTFYIPNIHCSSCIWLLEHLERLQAGIIKSEVNFNKRKVAIVYDPKKVSLQQIAERLDIIGYPPMINLEKDEGAQEKTYDKKLLTKLGVAGFCFGNVMLLAFPEYLGFDSVEVEYQRMFRWVSAIMALPVLFYSASDYFISAFKSLRQRYINIDVPIALGVVTLAIRSYYEIITATGAGYFDSLVSLIFFLLIGKWFQNLTYRNLSFERDYKSYFPLAVQRIKKGVQAPVLVKDIQKNDQLLIRNNEVIPADSILIDEQANIDYSFVSGESEPIQKHKGELIYAGGRLVGKQANFVAQKEVSQSYLTGLWNQHDASKKETRTLIDKVSQYFTLVIVAVATAAAIFWQGQDPSKTWLVFTAVLIVACPCALALATPFTMGSVLRVFARNRFYLKSPEVIERMQQINTIVFDKTGTLTESAQHAVSFEGDALTENEIAIISLAISSSTHPLSRTILQYLGKVEHQNYQLESFEEVMGKGIIANVNGLTVRIGSHKLGENAEQDPRQTNVFVWFGEQLRGKFKLQNEYRKGIKYLIQKLSKGFKLKLLSGDNDSEQKRLEEFFPAQSEMRFSQKPHDKLAFIEACQQRGDQVMMIGDGLNDAGALKQSQIGIAVAEDVSSFSPASDGILDAKELNQLNGFFGLTKAAKTVVIWSFVISFVYNIGGLSFAVAGLLTPLVAAILMPLSSITVVLFTTSAVQLFAKKMKL
jgi:Cu+-exporting ATPase